MGGFVALSVERAKAALRSGYHKFARLPPKICRVVYDFAHIHRILKLLTEQA